MSDKNYIKYYDYMNDKQKDAMTDLWMSGINTELEGRKGAWVQYTDVEKAVAIIIREFIKEK